MESLLLWFVYGFLRATEFMGFGSLEGKWE